MLHMNFSIANYQWDEMDDHDLKTCACIDCEAIMDDYYESEFEDSRCIDY